MFKSTIITQEIFKFYPLDMKQINLKKKINFKISLGENQNH